MRREKREVNPGRTRRASRGWESRKDLSGTVLTGRKKGQKNKGIGVEGSAIPGTSFKKAAGRGGVIHTKSRGKDSDFLFRRELTVSDRCASA